MSRQGKNIYKRKDGRWEGRYIKCRIDGKAKYGYNTYIFYILFIFSTCRNSKIIFSFLLIVNSKSQPSGIQFMDMILQTIKRGSRPPAQMSLQRREPLYFLAFSAPSYLECVRRTTISISSVKKKYFH